MSASKKFQQQEAQSIIRQVCETAQQQDERAVKRRQSDPDYCRRMAAMKSDRLYQRLAKRFEKNPDDVRLHCALVRLAARYGIFPEPALAAAVEVAKSEPIPNGAKPDAQKTEREQIEVAMLEAAQRQVKKTERANEIANRMQIEPTSLNDFAAWAKAHVQFGGRRRELLSLGRGWDFRTRYPNDTYTERARKAIELAIDFGVSPTPDLPHDPISREAMEQIFKSLYDAAIGEIRRQANTAHAGTLAKAGESAPVAKGPVSTEHNSAEISLAEDAVAASDFVIQRLDDLGRIVEEMSEGASPDEIASGFETRIRPDEPGDPGSVQILRLKAMLRSSLHSPMQKLCVCARKWNMPKIAAQIASFRANPRLISRIVDEVRDAVLTLNVEALGRTNLPGDASEDLVTVRAAQTFFERWAVMRTNYDSAMETVNSGQARQRDVFPSESLTAMNELMLSFRERAKPLCPRAESYGLDAEPLRRYCHENDDPVFAADGRRAVRRLLNKLEGAILKESRSATGAAARSGPSDQQHTTVRRTAAPKLTKAEANIKAREFLLKYPKATIRELAAMIGCSTGLVGSLLAWKAVKARRDAERPPKKSRVVSLTRKSENVIGAEDESLARLISEQGADAEPSPLEDDPPEDVQGKPRKVKVYAKR